MCRLPIASPCNFYTKSVDGSLYLIDSYGSLWYFTCHLLPADVRLTIRIMARLTQGAGRHLMNVGLVLALGLGPSQGCGRSNTLHPSDTVSTTSPQSLPFHADAAQPTDGGKGLAGTFDPKQASSLPFRGRLQPRLLPAGTLITVQLGDSLSAATARAGDAFTAAIATPLMVDQDTVLEAGTPVTGRVESVSVRSRANRVGTLPRSGYLRLTLSAVTVEGKPVELQTASLFARGTLQPHEGIAVPKGRRLTFRLTTPLALNASSSMPTRQSSGTATE